MTKFFQEKINLPSVRQLGFAVITIAIVSLVPLLKSSGTINIGGDTFIPFLPEHSYKMTYEWLDRNNGEYFTNTYRVWMSILGSLKTLGLSTYQAGFLLQFSIFFLSGLGIYKIYSVINDENSLFGIIPAVFYILSPHLLDHQLYQMGTIGIIWVIYYFIKFIKYKRFTFSDVILTNIFVLSIIDLPNPKYHFLLFITALSILTISLILRLIAFKDILHNLKYFVSMILISSYVLLPLIYFGYSFSKYNTEIISTKQDYGVTGETLDYDVAHINKMMRLFHTPNLDSKTGELINTPLYFFAYYLIPIFIIGIFPFVIFKSHGRIKRLYLLLYFMALLLIFMTKGSNPPFGSLYEILLSYPLFAFMRTTAGIVIYAAVFYALIYGFLFQYFYKNFKYKYVIVFIFLSFILIWGYPFWSGRYFLNRGVIATQKSKYGLIIPEDYFRAASVLEPYKLDAKVGVFPYPSGYQQNTWGYYGFIFYPWFIEKPTTNFDISTKEEQNRARVNLRFALHDKTTLLYGILPDLKLPVGTESIYQSKMIDIYRLPDQNFLPHFYVSKKNFFTNKIPRLFLQSQNSTPIGFFSLKNPPEILAKISAKTNSSPVVEYKKVNPTKYRLIVHRANKVFPIIFNENYHPDWKLYQGDMNEYERDRGVMQKETTSLYRIFYKNDREQASKDEVMEFIKNRLISTLGNLERRENKTYIYPQSVRTLAKTEPYRINFISRNFANTIQNDNLPDKYFFETFFQKEIKNSHLIANNYFNSWLIDTEQVCYRNISCIRNADGTFDMELVVEFWPQKLLNISLLISLGTILTYFLVRLLVSVKRKMNKTL